MHEDVMEALLSLFVTSACKKRVKRAIFGLANLIKATVDHEARPEFLKPKNNAISNDLAANKARLREGMVVVATLIEIRKDPRTKPYHETFISTPGPDMMVKRCRQLIVGVEGDNISTYPLLTKGDRGMSAVDASELKIHAPVMQAGADTSMAQGGGPLLLTSGNEPEKVMICGSEKTIYMGDDIEPTNVQVSKDSIVRVYEFALRNGMPVEKAKRILRASNIDDSLLAQYQAIGRPQQGEILVEKDGRVCRKPSQPTPTHFHDPTSWYTNEISRDGYKSPFVCVACSFIWKGKTRPGEHGARHEDNGLGLMMRRADVAYPLADSSTPFRAPSHNTPSRSDKHKITPSLTHSNRGSKPPQHRAGITKPDPKEPREKGKVAQRAQRAEELERFAVDGIESPHFIRRQPTKSTVDIQSTVFSSYHTPSQQTAAFFSSNTTPRDNETRRTHDSRAATQDANRRPDQPHRRSHIEKPLTNGSVKSDRHLTPLPNSNSRPARHAPGSNHREDASEASMTRRANNHRSRY